MTDGTVTWNFTYNPDGLRLSRSNDTTTYNYVYNGSQLTAMTVGENTLYFSYDADGTPMSVKYGDEEYYYTSNIQGDVIGIVNDQGQTVVTYAYDAWGNILSTTDTTTDNLGTLNPLRYRGYVYDQETNLYYLQSRHYNPNLGRFINADGLVATGQGLLGNNMFIYCGNNGVNRIDPVGQSWQEFWEAFTQALKQASGYFAVLGAVSQADTPAPGPADGVAAILAIGGLIACLGIATYDTIAAPTYSISMPQVEEKEETMVDTAVTTKRKNPIIFPIDPQQFNPKGLTMVVRTGTINGMLISWMDPTGTVEIFRWDENLKHANGPHYHVNGTGHYIPGISAVPEPEATIYFPEQ